MSKIAIECVVEEYTRYEPGKVYRLVAYGETEKQALLKLIDNIGMYTDSDSVLEIEEEEQRELSVEEIIDILEGENGDGCDFIMYLKNRNSGKVYIENDWEEIICE